MKRTLNYIIFDRLLLFIVGKKFNMLSAIGLNLKLFTNVDEKLKCPEFRRIFHTYVYWIKGVSLQRNCGAALVGTITG